MSLTHFAIQAGERCHAVYAIPATFDGASRIAKEANEIQAQQERALVVAALHPSDRPIPKGFYTDLDSQ